MRFINELTQNAEAEKADTSRVTEPGVRQMSWAYEQQQTVRAFRGM